MGEYYTNCYGYDKHRMKYTVDRNVTKRFDIIRRLGTGAYGVVWKAVHKRTNETYAIKKILDAFRDPMDAQRTFREIIFLKNFDHPSIIKMENVLSSSNNLDMYIVFEYMTCDLHNIIKRNTVLKDTHKRFITYQLLSAVNYIHSGNVIHRDLKPSNILINNKCRIKLADFGLARSLAQPPFTCISGEGNPNNHTNNADPMLTDYVATRWYRAPELLMASKRYTKGVDMWSLGCILGELYLGLPIFRGSTALHQIQVILSALPEITEGDVASIGVNITPELLNSQVHKDGRITIENLIPNMPTDALDLIKRILVFDPTSRVSAKEAIQHYFVEPFFNNGKGSRIEFDQDVIMPLRDDMLLTIGEYRSQIHEIVRSIKSPTSSYDGVKCYESPLIRHRMNFLPGMRGMPKMKPRELAKKFSHFSVVDKLHFGIPQIVTPKQTKKKSIFPIQKGRTYEIYMRNQTKLISMSYDATEFNTCLNKFDDNNNKTDTPTGKRTYIAATINNPTGEEFVFPETPILFSGQSLSTANPNETNSETELMMSAPTSEPATAGCSYLERNIDRLPAGFTDDDDSAKYEKIHTPDFMYEHIIPKLDIKVNEDPKRKSSVEKVDLKNASNIKYYKDACNRNVADKNDKIHLGMENYAKFKTSNHVPTKQKPNKKRIVSFQTTLPQSALDKIAEREKIALQRERARLELEASKKNHRQAQLKYSMEQMKSSLAQKPINYKDVKPKVKSFWYPKSEIDEQKEKEEAQAKANKQETICLKNEKSTSNVKTTQSNKSLSSTQSVIKSSAIQKNQKAAPAVVKRQQNSALEKRVPPKPKKNEVIVGRPKRKCISFWYFESLTNEKLEQKSQQRPKTAEDDIKTDTTQPTYRCADTKQINPMHSNDFYRREYDQPSSSKHNQPDKKEINQLYRNDYDGGDKNQLNHLFSEDSDQLDTNQLYSNDDIHCRAQSEESNTNQFGEKRIKSPKNTLRCRFSDPALLKKFIASQEIQRSLLNYNSRLEEVENKIQIYQHLLKINGDKNVDRTENNNSPPPIVPYLDLSALCSPRSYHDLSPLSPSPRSYDDADNIRSPRFYEKPPWETLPSIPEETEEPATESDLESPQALNRDSDNNMQCTTLDYNDYDNECEKSLKKNPESIPDGQKQQEGETIFINNLLNDQLLNSKEEKSEYNCRCQRDTSKYA